MSDAAAAPNYKKTLNLPQTDFAMKANLVQNEPASIKRWGEGDLYGRLRSLGADRKRWVFHDGPPYANGSIHLGHVLNKTLKDIVVRSRTMMGFDVPYVPGWDCHGLPIEHKVMADLIESGKVEKLNALEPDARRMAIRRACLDYAMKQVKLQRGQMERLLTIADYDNPYLTTQPSYEAGVLEILAELVEQDLVYRALKPVHWSIANETALADAELEYMDREDLSVYVDFEAADAGAVYAAFGVDDVARDERELHATPSFMIWTTTPWTLPANCAVAVHERTEYALARIDGNITVLATNLVEAIAKIGKAEDVEVLATAPGKALLGLRYRHPFVTDVPACGLGRELDTAKTWSIVAADYVTTEDGTGLVHTAPGHGQDDYNTGVREGIPVYCPVQGDGTYDQTVPAWLRGMDIWKANEEITRHLTESGHLYHAQRFSHSYPHDWRSKTPVIFRCTEQWFVAVDKPTRHEGKTLRRLALDAMERVEFIPAWGRNRLRGMLESRPDWCISRQRTWGVAIPAFETPEGETFMTAASVRAVREVVREKGSDAWFQMSPADLLARYAPHDGPAPDPTTLTKGYDILDVWFESGSSWNGAMRARSDGADFPMEVYLEGSDQHRGWFQSSLLCALGMTGRPPYKSVLTHGFMVDKDGKKLSKSKGDTVEDLFKKYGADVVRWWVASLSYEGEMKVDDEFFKLAGESYRKVRNTVRFMLSNLSDFDPNRDRPEAPHPASLDAWILGEYELVASDVIEAYEQYDTKAAHHHLYNFCNDALSAVYLAAVKDRLYCDRADSPRRRQTQAALYDVADGLCRLIAPILCHTADEAWRALRGIDAGDARTSVHAEKFIHSFHTKRDQAWPSVFKAREAALVALERRRAAGGLDNALDAGLVVPDPADDLSRFDPTDLADLHGVSRFRVDQSAKEVLAEDLREEPYGFARCDRSWRRDGTVRQRSDGGALCDRCADAMGV